MNIACIIITYNRKILLKNCIDHILAQELPPKKILIVDNCSTDNTEEFIKAYFHEKLSDKAIIYLNLSQNLGGAGGFHEGMKYALNDDFEWLWLMDDDGYPAENCLSSLYQYVCQNNIDAISPIQLDIEKKDELAFPVTYKNKKIVGKYDQLNDLEFIQDEANLFNGLLIKKEVIKNIGLPKSELFIRGDEVEYTKRLKRNNVAFGSLVSSIFYHPSDMNERIQVLFGLWTIRDAHSDFKNYYMFRNRAVAFIDDGNALLLPLDFIRYSYYFLIHKKFNWSGLKLWCIATYDGIKGKLGRHPKY
jgi:rhamnopyranosyl-N-acetylglucosaminyl-diphospho-decaprenol beta-1,3/1,4-galactofuranosyltransferase